MKSKLLSEEQIAWIKIHAKDKCRCELYEDFVSKFGKVITLKQYKTFRHNNKISGPRQSYSVVKTKVFTFEEEEFIKEHYKEYESPLMCQKLYEKFGTTHKPQQVKSYRYRHKLNSGFTGCFNASRPNPHKGDKFFYIKNSESTRYSKGHIPKTLAKINTEVITVDGYHVTKIAEHNWKFTHHLIWEKEYGPIPEGHSIIFLDGNRDNLSLDNLKLVSKEARGKLFGKRWTSLKDRDLQLAAVNVCELQSRISKYEEE